MILNGGTKVPDAGLVSHDIKQKYPLIVVEVGFTGTLDKLFENAARFISGSNNRIDVVVLIKVYETNSHVKSEFPWDISPHYLADLRKMDEVGTLAEEILSYYDKKNFETHQRSLCGNFLVPKN